MMNYVDIIEKSAITEMADSRVDPYYSSMKGMKEYAAQERKAADSDSVLTEALDEEQLELYNDLKKRLDEWDTITVSYGYLQGVFFAKETVERNIPIKEFNAVSISRNSRQMATSEHEARLNKALKSLLSSLHNDKCKNMEKLIKQYYWAKTYCTLVTKNYGIVAGFNDCYDFLCAMTMKNPRPRVKTAVEQVLKRSVK